MALRASILSQVLPNKVVSRGPRPKANGMSGNGEPNSVYPPFQNPKPTLIEQTMHLAAFSHSFTDPQSHIPSPAASFPSSRVPTNSRQGCMEALVSGTRLENQKGCFSKWFSVRMLRCGAGGSLSFQHWWSIRWARSLGATEQVIMITLVCVSMCIHAWVLVRVGPHSGLGQNRVNFANKLPAVSLSSNQCPEPCTLIHTTSGWRGTMFPSTVALGKEP